ncbi:uncharacterized protein [Euwallacea similis]|uniref:uncharacterized protein n=1 Tax=Euwallacea similis TaxID=1736056 RepID=UPI00344F26B8
MKPYFLVEKSRATYQLIANICLKIYFIRGLSLVKLPRGKHLSVEIKERVVNLYKSGQKQANIAKTFNLNKSIVCRIIRQYRVSGNIDVKKKCGRPRKTNRYQDKHLLKIAKNEPFLGSNKIKDRISDELGVEATSRTVRNRLLEGNLFGRRPAKKPLLSKKNRRAQLHFAV